MRTFEYLLNPDLAGLYWPGVLTGIAVALMAAVLSVLVVLKRLSFIGQGISHAAFGGMGVAAVLGVTGVGAAGGGAGVWQFAIVLGFCIAAAVGIAGLSDRRSTGADTAIGIVLVGSMALGALLMHVAAQRGGARGPGWESVLFGSIMLVGPGDVAVAWGVAAAVLGVVWWLRRPLFFWAFDEPAAPAFGVRGGAMRLVLMILLCLAIVTSMKLAGVVLATAILVLPGATALVLSERLVGVIWISIGVGLAGVLGGLGASFEMDLPPGPSIVAALSVLFALAKVAEAGRGRRSGAA